MRSMPHGRTQPTRTKSFLAHQGRMRSALQQDGDARLMRTLILFHRWLGVVFCLLFAMWFASGIVMHFMPFPSLSESERVTDLSPIDLKRAAHGPAQAVAAGAMGTVLRVRLVQRH